MLIQRTILRQILESLTHQNLVLIHGLPGLGLTTIAKQLSQAIASGVVLRDSRNPETLNLFSRNAALSNARPFILDNANDHTVHTIRAWLATQGQPRSPRFVVLGGPFNSSKDAINLRLGPLTLTEAGKGNLNTHWLRGGLPCAFLAPSDDEAFLKSENWICSLCYAHLPSLSRFLQPHKIRLVLDYLAKDNGRAINILELSKLVEVPRQQLTTMIRVFENEGILKMLPGITAAGSARTVKSPACYIGDTGLLHALLGIRSSIDLTTRPHDAASSWKAYVLGQLAAVLPSGYTIARYLSSEGASLDIVIVKDGRPCIAALAQHHKNPVASRGARPAADRLGIESRFIVTPTANRRPARNGFEVISLVDFLELARNLS